MELVKLQLFKIKIKEKKSFCFEQAVSDLISHGLLYSQLQGAYLSFGAAPNNQIFMLWNPFLETLDKHGAGTVEVPVPPIHIKEIGMYFKCSTTV